MTRFKGIIHEYVLKIEDSDVDTFSHLNHAAYLRLMEEARWDLYNGFGYTIEMVKQESKGPIILDLSIKYRKEVFQDETVTIASSCLEYNNLTGRLSQQMIKENGKVSAKAEFTFAYFDLLDRKIIPPSGHWKKISDLMMGK